MLGFFRLRIIEQLRAQGKLLLQKNAAPFSGGSIQVWSALDTLPGPRRL